MRSLRLIPFALATTALLVFSCPHSPPARMDRESSGVESSPRRPDPRRLHADGVAVDHTCKVIGRLRYANGGGPAAHLPVSLGPSIASTTDESGMFVFTNVRSGSRRLWVGVLEVHEMLVRSDVEDLGCFEVPEGGRVSGRVLAAEDHQALTRAPVLLRGAISDRTETRADGTFAFSWVPNGRYTLLVRECAPERRAEVTTVDVSSAAVAVDILVPNAPALRVHVADVPIEWSAAMPFTLELRDTSGNLLTTPPSFAIGSRGSPPETLLDGEGWVEHPPRAPARGRYVLSIRHHGWHLPLSEVGFESGQDVPPIHFRVPAGAHVFVSNVEHLCGDAFRDEHLAIGPCCAAFGTETKTLDFPRVPAGSHAVWRTNGWSATKLGDAHVPLSGDTSWALDQDRTAFICGQGVGDRSVRLRRANDDALVAYKRGKSPWFRFGPLAPGPYVLVVDDRRMPIELGSLQNLDLETSLSSSSR